MHRYLGRLFFFILGMLGMMVKKKRWIDFISFKNSSFFFPHLCERAGRAERNKEEENE